MGNDYQGQEKAIEELSALSNEAKEYLNHHLGNSLSGILGYAKLGKYKEIEKLVWHVIDDFEKAGIREPFFRAILKQEVKE